MTRSKPAARRLAAATLALASCAAPEPDDAAVEVARRLADARAAAPRWVGRHALKELTSAPVRRRLSRRPRKGGTK